MDHTPQVSRARLPSWLLATGLLLMMGSGALAARLIWEETSLSWNHGPQMIGFSLAHGGGVILFLFPPLLLLWLLVASAVLLRRFWKARQVTAGSLQALCSALALLALLSLPQGFWLRLFAEKFAHSPQAVGFLCYAAGRGELATVKSLIEHGVPPGALDREKKTALHYAAGGGNVSVVAYLVAKGLDVNSVSLWGDSPLAAATDNAQDGAIRYLTAHGGLLIRGTEAQHQKAAAEIVHRDIEEMDARRKK